jgi:hypothetical protein
MSFIGGGVTLGKETFIDHEVVFLMIAGGVQRPAGRL